MGKTSSTKPFERSARDKLSYHCSTRKHIFYLDHVARSGQHVEAYDFQMVNTIGGIARMDRKDFLLHDMATHAASPACVQHPEGCLNPRAFFPPTFELSNAKGCNDWLMATREHQSSDWLVKPPDNFAGVGLHFLSAQSVADAQVEQSCASLLMGAFQSIISIMNTTINMDFLNAKRHGCSCTFRSQCSRLVNTKRR